MTGVARGAAEGPLSIARSRTMRLFHAVDEHRCYALPGESEKLTNVGLLDDSPERRSPKTPRSEALCQRKLLWVRLLRITPPRLRNLASGLLMHTA